MPIQYIVNEYLSSECIAILLCCNIKSTITYCKEYKHAYIYKDKIVFYSTYSFHNYSSDLYRIKDNDARRMTMGTDCGICNRDSYRVLLKDIHTPSIPFTFAYRTVNPMNLLAAACTNGWYETVYRLLKISDTSIEPIDRVITIISVNSVIDCVNELMKLKHDRGWYKYVYVNPAIAYTGKDYVYRIMIVSDNVPINYNTTYSRTHKISPIEMAILNRHTRLIDLFKQYYDITEYIQRVHILYDTIASDFCYDKCPYRHVHTHTSNKEYIKYLRNTMNVK